MRPGIRFLLFVTLLLTALVAASGPALPAGAASTITVSTCDEPSLTQAINNAAAGDTIVFGCSGMITFAGYSIFQYTISKNLTIDGSGQNVILDGNKRSAGYDFYDGSSIFRVTNGVTLTLNGLTFANGVGGTYSACQTCDQTNSGGAITVDQGTLNVTNSTFTNNISTGLFGGGVIMATLGTVNVDNSTFSGNTAYDSGGAIQSLVSTLTVTNSTFSGNLTRTNGGGIDTVGGTATISNSAFTNNTANAYSGEGSGAGVANTGDMTITNSTFSGNQAEAGGAIANQVGTLNVIDSTLVGNHANWWANGVLSGTRDEIYLASSGSTITTLTNTILANGPTRSGSADAFTFGGNCVTNGTLNDGGGNFSDDETCGASHVATADLHLGTLANNGGPTQTIALTTGSVAINAAACISTINTDQRGYTRATTGNTCDAGAYEFGAVNPIKTTTLSAISGSGTYGSTATLTATLKTGSTAVSGKTISFKLNNTTVGTGTTNSSGVATLSGVSLSGIDAGSYSGAVSASFAGDSGYTSASGSGALTVNKADQTISFDLSSLPAKSTLDGPFDISSYASASSGLTVSFGSATTSVCTVSGSTVTIVVAGTCTINADQSGNGNYNAAPQVQQSFTVADKTPPVTIASAVKADSTAYTFGNWTNQAVTVTLSASDSGGSGLAATYYTIDGGAQQTYSTPFVVNGDLQHTITFWSVDQAGNEETPHGSVGVWIDATAPTLSGTATTAPNANGWYNTSVTIHWTCADNLSGVVSCPSDQIITTEGASETVSQSIADQAGNTTNASSSPAVNIDLTAPTNVVGTPDRTADSNGWYNHQVDVTFSGQDALSGIASYTSDSYSGPDNAAASVSGSCTDLAGNSTNGSFALAYDATAPTIVYTGNQASYDITATVTISCAASDNLSGIATTDCQNISAPAYTFVVGANTVSSSATDVAGNTASGSVTFTVTESANSLTTLTNEFITNRYIANRVSAPLGGIALANRINSPSMKQAYLNVYIMLVNQQRGYALTNQEADTLIRLAGGL
jgi:predicted outer membrane repeat protein